MSGSPRPEVCIECRIPLWWRAGRNHSPQKAPPGFRIHAGRGRCTHCYDHARKARLRAEASMGVHLFDDRPGAERNAESLAAYILWRRRITGSPGDHTLDGVRLLKGLLP